MNVTLSREELAGLKRVRQGFVRYTDAGWHIHGWAPLRIYRDDLSNIPDGAVRIIMDRLADLELVDPDDGGDVHLTARGEAAFCGVVSGL